MALQLRTLSTFNAPSDIPARAPMPDDAVGYVDFTANLHMTRTAAEVSPLSSLVFSRVGGARPGYFYGPDDLELSPNVEWGRIEFAADRTPLGLLIEDTWTQQIVEAMRTDLTAGTATGAVVAVSAASPDAWRQWYSVTPTGAGEASLALTTANIAVNEYVYVHFDVRGRGVVQLGLKDADVTGYANFDLTTGEAVTSDSTVVAQAHRRPGGSWTILARFRKAVAGAGTPFVASVAGMTTARLGGAGLSFEARAPRVEKNTSAGMPARSPYMAFKRDSDVVSPAPALMDLAGDFTVAFRARSGWFASRMAAALAFLSTGPNAGTEVRFDNSGGLIVRQTSGNVIVVQAPEIRWTPETIYRVGLSRRGSAIDVAVNGRVVSFDTGAQVADATPILLGSATSPGTGINSWSGHLQKAIWWDQGREPAALLALVDRWL